MCRPLSLVSILLLTPMGVVAADAPMAVMEMRGDASGALNDYNFNMSADRRALVFARSQANFQGAQIMVAEQGADGVWPQAQPIAFSDDRYKDSDPWLTPDGDTLYFVSNRPTPSRPDKKDTDIWRSRRLSGVWQAPEHLGDVVNSPAVELGPELHGGVLYFNSARSGDLNIYASKMTADGAAGAAMVLPAPINSPSPEGDFTLTPDGRMALFWSLRDGKGRIYAVHRQRDGWGSAIALSDSVNKGDFQFTPQVIPDKGGDRLAFASTVARPGQAAGMADIYTVPLSAVLPGPLPR